MILYSARPKIRKKAPSTAVDGALYSLKTGGLYPNAIQLRALSLRASPQTGAAIRFLWRFEYGFPRQWHRSLPRNDRFLLTEWHWNPDGSLSNDPSLRILWPEGLFRQPVCSVTVIPVFSVGSTVFLSGAPIRHFHGKPDVSYRRSLFPRAIPCREKLQIAYSPALSPSVPVGLSFLFTLFQCIFIVFNLCIHSASVYFVLFL